MAPSTIKMTYIAAQYRVRVQFTKADCLAAPAPPPELIDRAKAKLRKENRRGEIAFYRIFKTRLEQTWTRLRESNEEPSTLVAVTLATGAPLMPGVEVSAGGSASCLGRLTLRAPAELIKSWGFRPFKLFIGKRLIALGVDGVVDPAHLEVAWIRATRGERIAAFPILALAKVSPSESQHLKPYQVRIISELGEVVLQINNVRRIIDEHLLSSIERDITAKTAELSRSTGRSYQLRLSAVKQLLASANRGCERFGLDLPILYLAAVADAASTPAPPARLAGSDALMAGVTLIVSPDGLGAAISGFAPDLYRHQASLQEDAWEQFAKRHGITFGCTSELVHRIIDAVARHTPVAGLPLALGVAPRAGEGPFLFETYKALPRPAAGAASMRENQQRNIVQAGQVIAEIRYRTPPITGHTIFGKTTQPPPPPEMPSVTCGTGVAAQPNFTYTAAYAGVPKIEAGRITLESSLLWPGDVNLTTGNIHFRGPVEIKGSIEAGSTVEVHGDLHVHGMIQGGLVKVSGNLRVDGGILTNDQGLLQVGGAVTAAFIEHSTVYSKGPLTVVKAILSSKIYCETSVTLTAPDSLLSGSEVTCFSDLRSANIGRDGTPTSLRIGCHPRWVRAVAVRQARLDRLLAFTRNTTGLIANLQARRSEQLTAHHRELLATHQQRVARCEALTQRVSALLAAAKANAKYNDEAKIQVLGVLNPSCRLELAGQAVPSMPSPIMGVTVHAKRRNGSHFAPLAESQAA